MKLLAGHIFIFLMPQLTFRFAVFETHIAQICIANTTCKICRMNVLMMSSPCKSPISHCMLPFANLQLHAEHEMKGGGVPSPQGLQLLMPAAQEERRAPLRGNYARQRWHNIFDLIRLDAAYSQV